MKLREPCLHDFLLDSGMNDTYSEYLEAMVEGRLERRRDAGISCPRIKLSSTNKPLLLQHDRRDLTLNL